MKTHTNKSRRINTRKSKNIEPFLNKEGYNEVVLEKDGKSKSFPVALLVAKAFIPNPNNFPYVIHINGVKTDDRAENLMWSSERGI